MYTDTAIDALIRTLLSCRAAFPDVAATLRACLRIAYLAGAQEQQIANRLSVDPLTIRGLVVAAQAALDAARWLAGHGQPLHREQFLAVHQRFGRATTADERRLSIGAGFVASRTRLTAQA